MAQLRDAVSSQFIAEGTPLELAALAKEIGFDEVIFDDVGESFDPQELLADHQEKVDALTDAPEISEAYTMSVVEETRVTSEVVQAATDALAEARAAVDNG